MRVVFPGALAAVLTLAAGGPSAAQSPSPAETTVCLDVSGAKSPPVCPTSAGRLEPAENICTCRVGVQVTAPICPPDVKPPPESLALKAARKTASKDGSLVGDLFAGKPMCEAARLHH